MELEKLIRDISEMIQREGNVRAVFGEPTTLDNRKLVPIARFVVNLGGGLPTPAEAVSPLLEILIGPGQEENTMLVNQIMSPGAISCHIDDSVHHAAQLMWEFDCGALPVVTQEQRVVAMLTDRDICMAAYTQGKPLSEIGVRSAMSQALYTCSPDDSLEKAEQLMRDHQVRRLPVVDRDGKAVGILSLNDLAGASIRQHPSYASSTNEISAASVARTLAAVGAHPIAAHIKLS